MKTILENLVCNDRGMRVAARLTESFIGARVPDGITRIREQTSFYTDLEVDFPRRVSLILDGVSGRQICVVCGSEISPKKTRSFCGSKCSGAGRAGSKIEYTEDKKEQSNQKRAATNLAKYGVEFQSQRPENSKIIGESRRRVHAYIDYDGLDNISELTKLYESGMTSIQLGARYNCDYSAVLSRLSSAGVAIRQESHSSAAELELLEFVRSLGHQAHSDRNVISPLELDILIPESRLAIEYNGLPWHSERFGKDSDYHRNKTQRCLDAGISLFHVSSTDYANKPDLVRDMIAHRLGHSKRIGARECTVRELTKIESRDFFQRNHLSGTSGCKITLGLFQADKLVCAMSWGAPRFDKTADHEIIRVANLSGYVVVGGMSKLHRHYVRHHTKPGDICMTYSDRMVGSGGVYAALGYEFRGYTKPGYAWTRGSEVISRYACQKHKLVDLPEYSPEKSEVEIMQSRGYSRIWDSGNTIWHRKI